jgi:hypothetical protein
LAALLGDAQDSFLIVGTWACDAAAEQGAFDRAHAPVEVAESWHVLVEEFAQGGERVEMHCVELAREFDGISGPIGEDEVAEVGVVLPPSDGALIDVDERRRVDLADARGERNRGPFLLAGMPFGGRGMRVMCAP